MSNYAAWDLYSLGLRICEWLNRAKAANTYEQRRSYEGELAVMAREFNRKFFTGPYFPPDSAPMPGKPKEGQVT